MSKEKKKKGKGKKDKKQVGGLTNREKQIFLLTISELEHKIAWRKHLIGIIEEDLKLYEENLQAKRKDKSETINILEEAIDEQKALSEKIQRALPDAENSKIQAEERQARELASKLMQIKEERISYDAELDVLRRKLKSLESYDSGQIEEKIKNIEKQLKGEDAEEIFLRGQTQDKRRAETFRKEMQDILSKEAECFQDEISGKLDKKFERIAEETRWWADRVSVLKAETEHLEAINDLTLSNLKCTKMQLKQQKKESFKEKQQLQDSKAMISKLLRLNTELEEDKKSNAEFQDHLSRLDGISEDLKQTLYDQNDNLTIEFKNIQENEAYINTLEDKLSDEVLFGEHLIEFIEKAKKLLIEEAKYSLIVTHDGPPKKKEVIKDLRDLFEEATQFVYNREDKSIIWDDV